MEKLLDRCVNEAKKTKHDGERSADMEDSTGKDANAQRRASALCRVYDFEYPDGEQVLGVLTGEERERASKRVSLMEETGTLHMNIPRSDLRERNEFPLWGALRESGGWSPKEPSAISEQGEGGVGC